MKKLIMQIGLVIVLMTTAVGGSQKTTCRITGKTMDQCCCEVNSGKFYCNLTKKTYDQCCCDMK